MKRALAFLVFGPVLAAVVAMVVMTQAGQPDHGFAQIFAVAVFLFTLPVSAMTGCIDGVLSDLSVALRAALSAAAGALVAFSLAFVLFSWFFPPSAWLYFAFGGATCMGACSLLASELCDGVPVAQAKRLLGTEQKLVR
jgi:hypothetical protein